MLNLAKQGSFSATITRYLTFRTALVVCPYRLWRMIEVVKICGVLGSLIFKYS